MYKQIIVFIIILFVPSLVFGQGVAGKLESLHSVLDTLYQEMMVMSADLITVARGLAGFGAIFYIGSRVWRHLANAEPIDFYPYSAHLY